MVSNYTGLLFICIIATAEAKIKKRGYYMAIVKVNRRGKSYPIYKENNADEQIGTLYNNELFTWKSAWEGNTAGYSYQAISFRASDGSLAHGWIAASESDKVLANNICSLAKFTKKINNKTYYGFKMRRSEELFDRSGNALIGKLAFKDRCILCESSTAGASHPEWLSVIYLETGIGTGEYERIVSNSNAFVDLGYTKGSDFSSNASLIGSI